MSDESISSLVDEEYSDCEWWQAPEFCPGDNSCDEAVSSHLEALSQEPSIDELREDRLELRSLLKAGEITQEHFAREDDELKRQLATQIYKNKFPHLYALFCAKLNRRAEDAFRSFKRELIAELDAQRRKLYSRADYKVGELVTIVDGAFCGFTGAIVNIASDFNHLTVNVNAFDIGVPVTFGVEQVMRPEIWSKQKTKSEKIRIIKSLLGCKERYDSH